MDQLPYDLDFMHRFNLHKTLGLLIEDDDLSSIARVYGVKKKELKAMDDVNKNAVASTARELAAGYKKGPAEPAYTIGAIGDSLTSDRQSWAKILMELWENDPTRNILDLAVSGDTTYHIINRFYSTVLSETFDRAILILGTNDCRELDDEAHISNLSLDEYRRNMEYFIDTLKKKGKTVAVVTLPYVELGRFRAKFVEDNWVYDMTRIDKANDIIRDLAKNNGIGLIDFALALKDAKDDVFAPDGIHLSGYAHKILCELVLKTLP